MLTSQTWSYMKSHIDAMVHTGLSDILTWSK
ncbi:hypothetical protein F383_37790 [Gossypium arboreum]|uniref:Uncharacterized protein n=1 Tax=Gossypium arboreum TaxID=29729 RepID=A0A0B0M9H1_GOSAR|nr:hypothetical protein F383_37790 [Gossypium arboreum]